MNKRIINLREPKILKRNDSWYKKHYALLAETYGYHSCSFCGHPVLEGRLCMNCDYDSPYYKLEGATLTEEIEEE